MTRLVINTDAGHWFGRSDGYSPHGRPVLPLSAVEYNRSMTDKTGELALQRLRDLGLSATGLLHSTGWEGHRKRMVAGLIDDVTLGKYAEDLCLVSDAMMRVGAPICTDFWDVQSPAMKAAGIDEYAMTHKLTRCEFGPYIELLARCYGRLTEFKRMPHGSTAVATTLSILREVTQYVRAGNTAEMTATMPRLNPTQQAIVLWQQILTGTNRQIPFVHRDAYTHSSWGRFNVIEMWRYQNRADLSVDEIWGLTGFDQCYIRHPHNTNQIEHLAITAVAQMALRLPVTFLNMLEVMEWLLRKCDRIESEADKALNLAVAREFCHVFTVQDPQPACDNLERALSQRPA